MEGKSYLFVNVDSVVPQGTVLGPLVFLFNDLPSVVNFCLFADDCLICRDIKKMNDQYDQPKKKNLCKPEHLFEGWDSTYL